MSLFDVIRYPINEEFRLEDLRRIPHQAITVWWYDDIMKTRVFRNIAVGYSSHVEDICRMAIYMSADQVKYLRPMCDMLRKRIEQL